MSNFGKYNLCCNPFQLPNHRVKHGLRRPSINHRRINNLNISDYLCTTCRKSLDLSNKVNNHSDNANIQEYASSQDLPSTSQAVKYTSDMSQLSIDVTFAVVNEAFGLLNESPIAKENLNNRTYLNSKVSKVNQSLNKSLQLLEGPDSEINSNNFLKMIEELKIKFNDNDTIRSDKIRILTLLPETWSLRKVCHTMGCTKYMASLAKHLQKESGILSTPNKKLGRVLPNYIKSKVSEFYADDEISINMPGIKDYVSIRNENGKREHIQKRLILCNLKELYQLFKIRYSNCQIGFSKFASLRPQHCVLAGSSGTHTICVCSIHQNVKLMMLGCNMAVLTKHMAEPLEQYSDCLKMIVCPDPNFECYFLKCTKCPGTHALKNMLLAVLDENSIDEITYKYWISKPRTSLETFVKCTIDFVDEFCVRITDLLLHNYIAKKQSSYLKTLKDSLDINEFIVICDFAENYAFVIQNAASGFHWNNCQATIFPVVIYYKKNTELIHKSMVIISDCLVHDAIAVHEFTRITTNYIRRLSSNVKKIIYFSDGAPQQFKNFKNFVNLYYHKNDFGLNAEWHYFATAHGKGPCDGIGGTLKRIAARTSLQLAPDKQISTPQQLYDWAVKENRFPNIECKFLSKNDYISVKELLEFRYNKAKTIERTQKFHYVSPEGNGRLRFKYFSSSIDSYVFNIFKRVNN
ncbi:uncharacterized protein [Prorops nasuta]|uniref:uncharacterized protein n=1 Tax=Prorops nasuta TaxID=863751 RepID=UPI0034CE7D3C